LTTLLNPNIVILQIWQLKVSPVVEPSGFKSLSLYSRVKVNFPSRA